MGAFAGERPGLLVSDSGPDRTFRVTPPVFTGSGTAAVVTGSMLTGPWLTGPAGIAPGGTLGVLIDGISACAAILGLPGASWSVSAEISLDMCGPMPGAGRLLTAEARWFSADKTGGLAAGTVTGEQGQPVALFRQHTRWVGLPPSFAETQAGGQEFVPPGQVPAVIDGPGVPADLTELLGARIQAADGGATVDFPVTGDLANPLGNAHGGVIFAAVDLAAQAASLSVGGPARTASVRVNYTRPVLAGTTARVEARVAHRGRSLGVVHVTALNEQGKPAVIATVTTAPE